MPIVRRAIKNSRPHLALPREECVTPTARSHVAEGVSSYPLISNTSTPPGDGDDIDASSATDGCATRWFADPFYTVAETQRLLRCSHASVYRWIGRGKIVAVKLEGKTLVTGESLRRLAAELPKADIRFTSPPRRNT